MSPLIKPPGLSREENLPLRSHLIELRQRLIKSFIAVVVMTTVSFIYARQVFAILESRAQGINLIYIEMTEMIETYFSVALISGIMLSFPFLVYQFVMFLRPGLTPVEKRYLYLLLPGVTLSFVTGLLFGYFVLIPPAANFLMTFGSDIATPQIRVGNFVSLMTRLLFAIGLCFETPILLFFLTKIHVVTPELLAKYRKFAIVGAFIIGAMITPTFDPINQTLVALPIILLYEVGILLAKLARGKKKPA
ncbi:MAG: twin-arginine translocase subunit TatC [Chloroflexota bacterium]